MDIINGWSLTSFLRVILSVGSTSPCFNVIVFAKVELLTVLAFFRLACKLYNSQMTKKMASFTVIFCQALPQVNI